MRRALSRAFTAVDTECRVDRCQVVTDVDGIVFADALADAAGDTSALAYLTYQLAGSWRHTVHKRTLTVLYQLDDSPGADLNAEAASGALLFVNNGQPFRAHSKCTEGTGRYAGAETEAAVSTSLATTADELGRPAILEAAILTRPLSQGECAVTKDMGDLAFAGCNGDSKKLGYPGRYRRSAGPAAVGRCLSLDGRPGKAGATAETASAAVNLGKQVGQQLDPRVFFYGEAAGGPDEQQSEEYCQDTHGEGRGYD